MPVKLMALIAVSSIQGCRQCQSQSPTPGSGPIESGVHLPAEPSAPPDLKTMDIKVGTGAEVRAGDVVTLHYTGTFSNGDRFASSVESGGPFSFTMGAGDVIPGWEIGIAGMRQGGVRKLVIPPHLAYGHRGLGAKIPPNATLNFEIELIKVEASAAPK